MSNQSNPLISHNGHKLTLNESRFIDEYIKTGNASQSYLTAYNKDPKNPPRGYNENANKILRKTHIAEEINFRVSQLRQQGIADAEEIMQYFTDVMRGNITDQFGLDAPLAERTKAAQELAKRQIDMVSKMGNNQDVPEIKITLDWGDNK